VDLLVVQVEVEVQEAQHLQEVLQLVQTLDQVVEQDQEWFLREFFLEVEVVQVLLQFVINFNSYE
jgi:hypothetical protein